MGYREERGRRGVGSRERERERETGRRSEAAGDTLAVEFLFTGK